MFLVNVGYNIFSWGITVNGPFSLLNIWKLLVMRTCQHVMLHAYVKSFKFQWDALILCSNGKVLWYNKIRRCDGRSKKCFWVKMNNYNNIIIILSLITRKYFTIIWKISCYNVNWVSSKQVYKHICFHAFE